MMEDVDMSTSNSGATWPMGAAVAARWIFVERRHPASAPASVPAGLGPLDKQGPPVSGNKTASKTAAAQTSEAARAAHRGLKFGPSAGGEGRRAFRGVCASCRDGRTVFNGTARADADSESSFCWRCRWRTAGVCAAAAAAAGRP